MLGELWARVLAPLCALAIALGTLGCAAESSGGDGSGVGQGICQMGQTLMCLCPGKPSQVQTCLPNGTFSSCPCNAAGGGQGGAAAGVGPASSGAGGAQATNAGASGQVQGGRGGTGMAGMGSAGRGGAGAGAGAGAGSGGAAGMMAGGAGGTVAPGDDPFALERQACVDTINMYRMSLGRMPLVRATPEQETCSDMGAKQDGDSGRAHGSAGNCRGLGSQNTCPGYPLRVGGGTVDGTLKYCLKQMWDEGEPAQGVQACTADINGCYQDHGHWINMQSTTIGRVACGFYKMANGNYWMNQNFGR
jgi:hypothetical protein